MRREEQELTLTFPDLYINAWNNPLAHNSLNPADIIVRVEVPTAKNCSTYMQVSEKGDFDDASVVRVKPIRETERNEIKIVEKWR